MQSARCDQLVAANGSSAYIAASQGKLHDRSRGRPGGGESGKATRVRFPSVTSAQVHSAAIHGRSSATAPEATAQANSDRARDDTSSTPARTSITSSSAITIGSTHG